MELNSKKLPSSWEWAKIGDVCSKPQYGYTTKAAVKGTLKLLRTTDITSGEINWSSVPFCSQNPEEIDKYLLRDGDIVISRAGSVGFSHLVTVPPKSVFASYLIRFNPYIDQRYFKYFLLSPDYWAAISEKQIGIAIPNVNATKLSGIDVPIAPKNEQHRIVAKIEELFSELDKGVENFTTAREQLNVYRQSLLKQAFEGKLTEEWRNNHANRLETADQLLDRIKQKRNKRYREQLAKWEKAVEQWEMAEKEGKKPTKPRKLKKTLEISKKEIDELPALPVPWKWITFGELVSGKERAMQSGPFGSNLKHSEFTEEGVLVLGIDNVLNGKFSMGSENRISLQKFEELKKYKARPNDLLITVMASLGRTCIVPDNLEEAIVTKHVYRISMEEQLLFSSFYNLVLQSNTVSRKRMFENAQGQTRPGLNSTILWELPVPLCDTAEQKEIVNILDAKLVELDRIEMTLEAEVLKANVMRQSILKKAFAGQLVAQNANDEPTSELLARIKIEREKAQKEAKRLRPPRGKTKKRKVRIMANLMEVVKGTKDWLSAQDAFSQCGIADGSRTDDIEKIYEELRTHVKANKIAIERRGDEDWLRAVRGD